MIEQVIGKAISAVKQEIIRSVQVLPQVEDRRRMVFQLMVKLSVIT